MANFLLIYLLKNLLVEKVKFLNTCSWLYFDTHIKRVNYCALKRARFCPDVSVKINSHILRSCASDTMELPGYWCPRVWRWIVFLKRKIQMGEKTFVRSRKIVMKSAKNTEFCCSFFYCAELIWMTCWHYRWNICIKNQLIQHVWSQFMTCFNLYRINDFRVWTEPKHFF